jgi:hypothetical protein
MYVEMGFQLNLYRHSNYIDNLAPHPTMLDNEVPLGEDTFKKMYTQLIKALNDVRIQKSTNSTLSAVWNEKILKYFYQSSESQCCWGQK